MPTQNTHNPPKYTWPKNFLWGAASSAHQVEGMNTRNDWWQWEHEKRDRVSGEAANHYHRYAEDFQLARKLGATAQRISIEWSRIEPKPGVFDENAIQHYRQVLQTLQQNKMRSFVTLHHFTLPSWFAARGGFETKESVYYFTRFVKYCAEELGDLVDFWITINEPLVYAEQGWYNGIWPPEKKNTRLYFKVIRNLARAHRKAYKVLHETLDTTDHTVQVGFAHNPVSWYLYRPHALVDNAFAHYYDWFRNHRIYRLTKGQYDFIGINYYFHQRIKKVMPFSGVTYAKPEKELREVSSVGWEIYPQGLFDVLIDLSRYKVPLYITENGIATTNDTQRERFIEQHLAEVRHALKAGVDIRSYLYWSLTDSYEWEHGYDARFGLIGIDYKKDFKRTVRKSAQVYAKIMKQRDI